MRFGNGVGSINAQSIGVQGTCSGCPAYTSGMPPASDPLATLPVPTNPYGSSTPFTLANNQAPVTLNPGWYSKMDIGNSDIITLNPGTYWISGPIVVGNSATLTGSGVFIYFAGTSGVGSCTLSPLSPAGCITLGNNATVTLSAQTSGTYEGILFYQARTNAINVSFANTSTYTLSGAMYFPSASVTLGNAGGSNDCTMFVAQNINMAGNGGGNMNFSNTCSSYGGSPLLTVSLAE